MRVPDRAEFFPLPDRSESFTGKRMVRWSRCAVLAAVAAFAMHIVAALFAERQLFGDGVWFLLNLASRQGLYLWVTDWSEQFYLSRAGGYLFIQGPSLLAMKLGVRSLPLLGLVYGLTLYLHAPLSLYLSTRYARDRAQALIPAICLVAGSMNAAVYIVTDSHLMVSLYMIALCILLFGEEIKGATRLLLYFVSLPLLLCYESMLFFGVILIAICIWRLIRIDAQPNGTLLFGGLAIWYALGVVFAAMSTIYPFYPANKSDFIGSLFFMFASDHLPARVSTVVLVAVIAIVCAPKRFRRFVVGAFGVAALSILYLFARIVTGFEPHTLLQQNTARTLNLTVPLIATGLAIAFRSGRLKPERTRIAAAWVILGMLCFTQAAWSVAASSQWSGLMATLRLELALNTGPIPYSSSVMSKVRFGRLPLALTHYDWPLLPLSIYASEGGAVKSLVLPPTGGWFLPFDPYNPDDLPKLGPFGVNYDQYFGALQKKLSYKLGDLVELSREKSGLRYLASGWSHPEEWATWIDGQEGKLDFLVDADGQKPDVALDLTFGAQLCEQQPRLTAEVVVNGVSLTHWTFNHGVAGETLRASVRIPKDVYWKTKRLSLQFRIKETVKSPSELGQGADSRKLGLALINLRMSRAK
jgi:hypothetical protein